MRGNKNGNRTTDRKSAYKLNRISEKIPGADTARRYTIYVNPAANDFYDPEHLQKRAAPYLAMWFAQSPKDSSFFKNQILRAILYYVENNPEVANIDIETAMIFEESEVIADMVAARVLDEMRELFSANIGNISINAPSFSNGVPYHPQDMDEDTAEFYDSFIEYDEE